MKKVAILGYGAIARYVQTALPDANAELAYVLARPGRENIARANMGSKTCIKTDFQPADLVIDCAGHSGLLTHGETVLRAGCSLITISIGALADDTFFRQLRNAALAGGSQLHLATGAIGALDALTAAKTSDLTRVVYTGRKPPQGWRGSPAEEKLDLDALLQPTSHFTGSARSAALLYPKNANVAAAVALAGLGFDNTEVELIADPSISDNIHHISATGTFGHFTFEIAGNALPDNPRSSALAAMSLVKKIADQSTPVLL